MTLIADNITLCSSVWKKASGLMFRFPKGSFAYIFPFAHKQRFRITMWFVFYPITILFLDEYNRIVEITSLKPFTCYTAKKFATTFIELPYSALQQHHLAVGQKILWSKDFVKSP